MLGAFFSQDWVVVGDKGLFNYIDIGGGSLSAIEVTTCFILACLVPSRDRMVPVIVSSSGITLLLTQRLFVPH
jgi:hypothetical protein